MVQLSLVHSREIRSDTIRVTRLSRHSCGQFNVGPYVIKELIDFLVEEDDDSHLNLMTSGLLGSFLRFLKSGQITRELVIHADDPDYVVLVAFGKGRTSEVRGYLTAHWSYRDHNTLAYILDRVGVYYSDETKRIHKVLFGKMDVILKEELSHRGLEQVHAGYIDG